MKKIKILYMISSLRNSGPVNVLYDIVKYLDPKIFEVTILSFKTGGSRDRKTEFEAVNATCICLNKTGMNMMLHGTAYIQNVVEKIKPDIIHAHCFRSTLFLSQLSRGNYKKIVTLHNVPYEDYISSYGKVIGTVMAKTFLRALYSFDRIIACSQSVADKLKSYHVVTDVVVNGIDNIDFTSKENVRKKLGFSTTDILILSVGTLSKRKDPDFILKNFLNIQNHGYQKLIFLGDGTECQEFRQHNIPKKTSVFFMGNVNNVDEYLAAADIYVSASKSEGMPLSVLEAMRAGLPLLLSNIEPHKEIMAADNAIGKLFVLKHADDFFAKLSNMMTRYRNYDKVHIKQVFEKNFYAGIMSQRYQKIYEELLK